MKSCKLLYAAAFSAALALAACTPKARVDLVLKDAPGRDVEVRLLEINSWKVLDTLKTASDGSMSYSLEVAEGKPEFVYLYSGGVRLASLLLHKGDRVKVEADTLGAYTVDGSEDSQLLKQTDSAFAAFASEMAALDAQSGKNREMAAAFVKHYREDVAFVVTHPKSLVCVPVLYESLNEYTPVFGQPGDALLFRRVVDSLKTVYPESAYVKALEKETQRREGALELRRRLSGAQEMAFPEILLPGMDGNPKSLTEIASGSKAVLVHFWSPAVADHKMFNLDVLKPIYERYASRGFEIYAVAVASDKTEWASVVASQKLPWINVYDRTGQSMVSYNVADVPASFLISEGKLDRIDGEKGLRRQLDRL
ncbi:MAG: TlpA family protein disulfide reductase [Bacteroidales bacterium]|nr:TlpA family protein disulfide reductase [Bacteroidales bacterium]